ncbi:MAG: DUF4406 domain-containing protein [Prevotella sp.]|nr:DUF4406 domain-containing protein [Prevotella sp.]
MMKMKRRIYISGPMTGIEPREYRRRFRETETILRRHGYGCINPCRVWPCRFPWLFRLMNALLGKRLAYAVVLCYDLLLLMTRADGIVMLPGWQASRGAQIENYVSMHFWMQGISKAVTEEINKIK